MLVSRFFDGIAGSAFLSVAGKRRSWHWHSKISNIDNMIGGTVGDVSPLKSSHENRIMTADFPGGGHADVCSKRTTSAYDDLHCITFHWATNWPTGWGFHKPIHHLVCMTIFLSDERKS